MSLLAALTDLVLPLRCVGCGRPGAGFCPACLPGADQLRTVRSRGVPVHAATVYDGAVRAALIAYKERGRSDLRRPLGELLARAVGDAVCRAGLEAGSRVLLVPVPSSAAARGARGGDPLARLVARAGAEQGLRPVRGALRLVRSVRDSAHLGVAEREANLEGALRARPGPPGAVAVLVDDIVTSGTTLREAERALRAAGWPVAAAAVVAATPRRDPGSAGHGSRRARGSPARPIGSAQRSGLAWG